jgi:hypothetical protein
MRMEGDATAANRLGGITGSAYYYGPPSVFPPSANANIAFVSFHSADDTPATDAATAGFTEAPDVGYTQLLRDNGHTVTRVVTSGTPDTAALNGYDLVIISRSVPSGDYQDAAEAAAWNGITSPTIVMGGYILRNSRLGYTTGGTIPDTSGTIALTVNNPNHPIFAGVPLDANNNMVNTYANLATYTNTNQRGISVNTSPLAGGGTVLAKIATAGDAANSGTAMIIGEWQAGSTMGNGSADTLGGHRLVFLSGSRELSGLTSQGAGIYDLTDDGAQLFLNAVNYMAQAPQTGPEMGVPVVADGNITITFPAGAELETSPDLQTWTPSGDTSGSVTEAIGAGAKYYRARQD